MKRLLIPAVLAVLCLLLASGESQARFRRVNTQVNVVNANGASITNVQQSSRAGLFGLRRVNTNLTVVNGGGFQSASVGFHRVNTNFTVVNTGSFHNYAYNRAAFFTPVYRDPLALGYFSYTQAPAYYYPTAVEAFPDAGLQVIRETTTTTTREFVRP